MTDAPTPTGMRTRLRPAKRQAIERAARSAFSRLGYERASIDLIAAEAGVSTRTIYNHFQNKQQLFAAVLVTGATDVADTFIDQVDAAFSGTDPEADLTLLAHAIVTHRARFPEHFAIVRRMSAESDQLPPETTEAWLHAGPQRVRATITARLEQLDAAGHLTITDVRAAARHLVALTNSEMLTRPDGGAPPTEADINAAVHVFLHGYAKPGP